MSMDLSASPLSPKAVAKIKEITGELWVLGEMKGRQPKMFYTTTRLIAATNNPVILKQFDAAFYLLERNSIVTYLLRHLSSYNRFGKRVTLRSKDLHEIKDMLNTALYEDKNELNICDEKITLDEWCGKWLDYYKSDVVAPNTLRHYKQVYYKHISPELGKMPISKITQLQVKALIQRLEKRGYKYKTKSKVKLILVDMFDRAIANEFLKKNVAKGIKIPREEQQEHRALSLKDQMEFLDCSKGTFYDNLFIVAIHSGLRPGEICALRESDLDFANKKISVKRTLLYQKLEGDEGKEFHLGPPKTKTSVREVPMIGPCEIALKKQILQHKAVMSKSPKEVPEEFQDLLFTTKYGTPINSVVLNAAIRRIIDEVNLKKPYLEEMESFSAHSFRHTFATRCFEAGMQPKMVQELLGHANISMTMDLYTHVLEEHKTSEMQKLDEKSKQWENFGELFANESYEQYATEKEKILDPYGVKPA